MSKPEFQEWDKKKLLQKGDKVVVRVPPLNHPVTINEIHAFQLGFAGLFVGLAYGSGLETPAALLALTLVGYAILGNPAFKSLNHDAPNYKTIGMKTIKHEPWWFLMPFIASFVVGAMYFAPAISVPL